MKTIKLTTLQLNQIEDPETVVIAQWVGDDDILVESGDEFIKRAQEDGELKNPTLGEAVRWVGESIRSGNSYEVLVINNGHICKLDFSTLWAD